MLLHDQQTALERGAGTTMRHENLRVTVTFDKPHPHSGLLTVSSRHARYPCPDRVQLVGRLTVAIPSEAED